MKLVSYVFKFIFTSTLIITLTVGSVVGYFIRAPMPQVAGTIKTGGVQNEVTIYRDEWGVPHIYAETTHDLFFAQGYVHAQDRFWQMEYYRRLGSGRLSELFGQRTLEFDRFIRTLGWARTAAQDEAALDQDTRLAFQWYADGVNAYLTTHSNLGLEFTLLGAQGVSYKPEQWTVLNTLTWLKVLAWDLGGNLKDELIRVKLIQTIGWEASLELRPLYPGDHPIIVPNPVVGFDASAALAAVNRLNELTGGGLEGIGSNNWVISGALTDTGKPYLANDPHLRVQMPSIWYENGLHCRKIADYCQYDVVGVSLAGAPAVILGHNQNIAWGATNLGPDVQDLFLEKINPDNPNQYEVNGAWVDAKIVPELIRVRGKVEPAPPGSVYNELTDTTNLTLNVRITRHGPLINDAYPAAANLSGEYAGIQIPTPSALALRWTALTGPAATFRSALKINQAKNWDEFRAALHDWVVPAQNFVYADKDNNIGYQAAGQIPIRRNHEGLLPVPGWTDDYEWVDAIPFDQLPYLYNPPEGYIFTANNAVVGDNYPYLLTRDWADRGYRAERIRQMLTARQPVTLEMIKAQQGDNLNLSAQEVLPYLTALTFENRQLQNGLQLLKSWDYQQHKDSAPAALYNLFWVRLINNTFLDEVPEPSDVGPGGATMLAMRNLLPQPDNHWWDNVTTPDKVETRDDILRQSFSEAYQAGDSLLGADPASWTWGRLHTATFRNQTLGRSGIGWIEFLFNRGPVAASGGPAIINAAAYELTPDENKNVNLAGTFEVTMAPSLRLIVDLSNFGNSQAMLTTGQSGHPFNSHYTDMIEPWQLNQYHTLLWEREAVSGAARTTLVLTP